MEFYHELYIVYIKISKKRNHGIVRFCYEFYLISFIRIVLKLNYITITKHVIYSYHTSLYILYV